jgi:hypothetical protein
MTQVEGNADESAATPLTSRGIIPVLFRYLTLQPISRLYPPNLRQMSVNFSPSASVLKVDALSPYVPAFVNRIKVQ